MRLALPSRGFWLLALRGVVAITVTYWICFWVVWLYGQGGFSIGLENHFILYTISLILFYVIAFPFLLVFVYKGMFSRRKCLWTCLFGGTSVWGILPLLFCFESSTNCYRFPGELISSLLFWVGSGVCSGLVFWYLGKLKLFQVKPSAPVTENASPV